MVSSNSDYGSHHSNYASNYYHTAHTDINASNNNNNNNDRRTIASSMMSSGGISNMLSITSTSSSVSNASASYVHSEASPRTTSTTGTGSTSNVSATFSAQRQKKKQNNSSGSRGSHKRGGGGINKASMHSKASSSDDPYHLSDGDTDDDDSSMGIHPSMTSTQDNDNDDDDDGDDVDDNVSSSTGNLTNDETLLTNDASTTQLHSSTHNSTSQSQGYSAAASHNHMNGIPLANPAIMTDQALQAELQFRGVETYRVDKVDRSQLEQAVKFARRSSSGGNTANSPVINNNGGGSGLENSGDSNNHRHSSVGNNTSKAVNMAPRPPPNNPPTTAATTGANTKKYLPDNIRLRTSNPDIQINPATLNANNKPVTSTDNNNNNNNNNNRHIPLTSQNKIPPQILNLIRTSADRNMITIDLSHKQIGDTEVAKLAEALIPNMTVEILNLNYCNISDRGIKSLCEVLNKNEIIEELYLDGNLLSVEGAADLSTALITNETLRVLTLNENGGIGDRGVVYLIGALEHNTTLVDLKVYNCGCGGGDNNNNSNNSNNNHGSTTPNRIEQIEEILHDRQIDSNFESLLERLFDDDFRVTGIDLSGRKIGTVGVSRLAEALADNTQVRQLWLRDCGVNDDGAMALASCLEQNMTIVDLFLGRNQVGDEGLKAISDALALSNLTLVSLEMDENMVGDEGIDYFSEALEKSTSLLVASFDNNQIRDFGKLEKLQKFLGDRRSGLNLVSFVVDPDGGSTVVSGTNNGEGVVNMSVCSSYMPSTYRRAGMTSVADSNTIGSKRRYQRNDSFTRNGVAKPFPPAARRGSGGSIRSRNSQRPRPPPPTGDMASHNFSVYNKAKGSGGSVANSSAQLQQQHQVDQGQAPGQVSASGGPQAAKAAPPPPPPQAHLNNNRVASHHNTSPGTNSDRTGGKGSSGGGGSSSRPRRDISGHSQSTSSPTSRRSGDRSSPPAITAAEMPPPMTSQYSSHPQIQTSQMRREVGKDRELRRNNSHSHSHHNNHNSHHRHDRFSSSDSALHKQQATHQRHIHRSADNQHPLHRSLDIIAEEGSKASSRESSSARQDLRGSLSKNNSRNKVVPVSEKLVPVQEDSGTVKTELSTDEEHEETTQTSKNFDTTLKKLCRRVEIMRYMNRFAATHYRARHFWCWFIPISFSICLSGMLSFISAANISSKARMSLSVSTGAFCLLAFVMNFFQTKFGWSSLAEIHRSSETELAQVAMRLDSLKMYENGHLCSKTVSSKTRANAMRDLYRIDVYLQAVMKCTPQVPDNINETFGLLASRLKSICLKYPHAVKMRLKNGAYEDEPMDPSNPVPVEMQIDALEMLSKEIRNYWLFPMFMPNPVEVVSRTIDMFFAEPQRPESSRELRRRSDDDYSDYSREDDHHRSRNDIV